MAGFGRAGRWVQGGAVVGSNQADLTDLPPASPPFDGSRLPVRFRDERADNSELIVAEIPLDPDPEG